ncbi:MAG: threonine--tRNA ligase [Mycoplasmataceae bacterium]|nr:threonine--tRNA ligase [Mycoplasmataceae bacterium]
MEKIYIKKINKEIEIDSWSETNKVALEVISKFLIKSNLSYSIINSNIDENGFWIDFLVKKNISENSLPLLEGKIKKEFSKDIKVNSKLPTTIIKKLKLRGVSGLTLKNDSIGNRIFGFATIDEIQFKSKLLEIEEREQRDHRKIGKELDLFYIDELSGKGLPIWLENGVILKKQIKDYIWKQEEKYGSSQIETPVLGSIDLYKTSGHYEHYNENMFPEMKIEKNETFILRPMACPHHVLIYRRKPRSFRDLPIRFAENVKQYRYEHSGSLIGLERVRAMELTDSHIFLREDQLKNELKKGFNLIQETLTKFNIEIDYIELALYDPNNLDKYHGDEKLWKKSQKILKEFLNEQKIKYVSMEGEAAFYGPKIDVQIKTALGHQITVSTIQVDFLLPEKFNLEYIDSNKEKIRTIMLHRGLIGTYERFISVLLEQTKGDLPMWLAPQQAIILPVNNKAHLNYAKKVFEELKKSGVRVKLDDSDERLSNKIRKHQQTKIKTQIILGDNEMKNKTVSFRYYGQEETKTLSIKDIIKIYKTE